MKRKVLHNLTKSALVLISAILLSSFGCKKKVDINGLILLKEKYAEVLVDNHANTVLSDFKGELGEGDCTLVAFFLKKRHNKYHLLVEQYEDNDILLLPVCVPDTVSLFTYSAAYNGPLIIYDDIQTLSIRHVINDYITTPMNVVDVDGLWLKIRIDDATDTYEGWISPNEYCSNPYTTCN